MKLHPFHALSLLLAAALPASAQNMGMEDVINPEGPTGGGSVVQAPAPSDDWMDDTRRVRQTLRVKTIDGSLSAADFKAALAAVGGKMNENEAEALRQALEGKLYGTDGFAVEAEARQAAVDLIYTQNLFDDSVTALAGGKTYGGTEIPRAVKEVVARAKLNGAVAYDVTETNSDGEGKFSDYPAVTPPTLNMAFAYTEITPKSLLDDMHDTSTHLRIAGYESVDLNGEPFEVTRYKEAVGGTGSISAAYDHAFHPVKPFAPSVLQMLGYPADLDSEAVGEARTSSGNKWSSNCGILSDGSIHCLPAVRRHAENSGLILTNPALSRGHQMLWNGHLRVEKGVVTYIGTSGHIAKRAAEGKERYIDPVPLLKAWGFELAPGLQVTSEHGSARPVVDSENAVIKANPANMD